MFIQYGGRRINLDVVKEVISIDREYSSGICYKIEFLYLNGTKEEINFFNNKEERDEILNKIDQ
jgi:hypothetical protein